MDRQFPRIRIDMRRKDTEGMEPRYPTPRDLVEALQLRSAGARQQLWQVVRAPLGRLLEQLIARHGLNADRDVLILHALHSAETYLRTHPSATFKGVTWNGFRAAVLVHVGKMVASPFGTQATTGQGDPFGPDPLPECRQYDSQTFFRPYERLGDYWFGGDWFAGREAPDGSYWVLLADVTGHGYHAYLLACGLPGVWQRCWEGLAGQDVQPADVLRVMHELLCDCLPEGIFLECALVRLGPEGDVTVSPAGHTRILVRRGQGGPSHLLRLRGTWLGLYPPAREDQHVWVLGHGDELLLATDGVYDQLEEVGGPHDLAVLVSRSCPGPLFEGVCQLLEQALARGPQRDDMTMVFLRRRVAEPADVSLLRQPSP